MPRSENKSVALLLIDVQLGFLDPIWGPRNNPAAEENMRDLLGRFRVLGLPVIHIQHLSRDATSPLRPGQKGAEFAPGLGPILGERIFQKQVNSAFIGTGLERYLRSTNIQSLVMVGFTSDHCVSTSARMAANLGFEARVVGDATVTFDRKNHPADLVHAVSLASLSGEFATVLSTHELQEWLSEPTS